MNFVQAAKEVFTLEINELKKVKDSLDNQFSRAIELISCTNGRVIICGMGKSGIIGKKITATLASTGTPSYFLHPGEAFHGDLGMVKGEDVFIGISYSGETDEVIRLLPFLKNNGNRLISITGNENSTLAKNSDIHLNVKVSTEACPHQLAPTTSTTATLVMGDAIAIAMMIKNRFEPKNFAMFHPGGSLGKRLLNSVHDEMIHPPLPTIDNNDSFENIVNVMTDGKLGICIVLFNNSFGLITDGDLRRAMKVNGPNVFELKAKDIATYDPIQIHSSATMTNAIELMENKKVNTLIVIDKKEIIGILKK